MKTNRKNVRRPCIPGHCIPSSHSRCRRLAGFRHLRHVHYHFHHRPLILCLPLFSLISMDILGLGRPTQEAEIPQPLSGAAYLGTLHKYLLANFTKLAPPRTPAEATWLQQSYTLLTLGLDPTSAPLSRTLKVPLTLGFGGSNPSTSVRNGSSPSTRAQSQLPSRRPLVLRLPPDRLLYLLLRWQSLPQKLQHVGRTDEPIAPGVPIGARGARADTRVRRGGGDVESVRSWAGSMRSVSMGSMRSGSIPGLGWLRKEEMDEGESPVLCGDRLGIRTMLKLR